MFAVLPLAIGLVVVATSVEVEVIMVSVIDDSVSSVLLDGLKFKLPVVVSLVPGVSVEVELVLAGSGTSVVEPVWEKGIFALEL